MSTPANILVKMTDGKWASIYTHSDGYPDHHKPILEKHYNSQRAAEKLIALGDLSVLDKSADTPPAGHSFSTPVKGYCVAYGRDRGETDTKAQKSSTLLSIWPDNDWAYFWNGESWITVDMNRVGNRNDIIAMIEKKRRSATAFQQRGMPVAKRKKPYVA